MNARIDPALVRLRVAENSVAVYHAVGDAVHVRDHQGKADRLWCMTCQGVAALDCAHVRAVRAALDGRPAAATEAAA